MELEVGKMYRIKRKKAEERFHEKKVQNMEYLSAIGKGDNKMLLFRHAKGYKEAFLARLVGKEIIIEEMKR